MGRGELGVSFDGNGVVKKVGRYEEREGDVGVFDGKRGGRGL